MDYSFAIRDVKSFHLVGTGRDYWGDAQTRGALHNRYHFKPGWQTVYARSVESPVVRVEFADGAVGWGEACAPICPEAACLLVDRLAAPLVRDREFGEPSECWDLLFSSNHCRGYGDGYWLDAIAAVDVAIWDALGHREQRPVAAMLSEAPRTSTEIYLSGPRRPTRVERIDYLRQQAGEGVRAVKLFVGPDIDAACDELDALQRGVPDIRDWMVDALWSYADANQGIAAKRAFSARRVRWLECPLQPEDLEGHRALVDAPGAPIALGEHFRTRHHAAPWITAGAVQILQPDICRMGFTEALRIARSAAGCGIAAIPHAGSGLLLVQAAALQFACAWPSSLPTEYQASLGDGLPGAVSSAWHVSGGCVVLPDWPGLGVRIDESALLRYVVKH